MIEQITSNQKNRLGELLKETLPALGLSKEEAQGIIENGNSFQIEIKEILQKMVCLRLSKEFDLKVPDDYDHDTQIDSFVAGKRCASGERKYCVGIHHIDDALTSKNFAKVTGRLEPGKTYRVKIFHVLKAAAGKACIKFLKKQEGVILAGAQGLTLVADLKYEELLPFQTVSSFDEEESLWINSEGKSMVPYMYQGGDDDREFNLCTFNHERDDDDYVLCFCEIES